MNAHSDVILATYYPLNGDFSVREPSVVRDDLGRLYALYPGKEIYLLECGCPSGALCNSSEERQAEFVRHTFAAWDQHRDQVKIVLFMWLHDVPPSWVDGSSRTTA